MNSVTAKESMYARYFIEYIDSIDSTESMDFMNYGDSRKSMESMQSTATSPFPTTANAKPCHKTNQSNLQPYPEINYEAKP